MKKILEEKLKKFYKEGALRLGNKLIGFFEFDGNIYCIERRYVFENEIEDIKREIVSLANNGEDECHGFLYMKTNGEFSFCQQ